MGIIYGRSLELFRQKFLSGRFSNFPAISDHVTNQNILFTKTGDVFVLIPTRTIGRFALEVRIEWMQQLFENGGSR